MPEGDASVDTYLRFAHRNVGYVIDGKQDATARLNLERDITHITPEDTVKLHTPSGNVFAYASIEDVWTTKLQHAYFDMVVTEDRSHPASGALELKDRLEFHYDKLGELDLDTEVTVVCFDVTQLGGATPDA